MNQAFSLSPGCRQAARLSAAEGRPLTIMGGLAFAAGIEPSLQLNREHFFKGCGTALPR